MEYHHKSGAQKRKEKAARDKIFSRSQRYITGFVVTAKSEDNRSDLEKVNDRSNQTDDITHGLDDNVMTCSVISTVDSDKSENALSSVTESSRDDLLTSANTNGGNLEKEVPCSSHDLMHRAAPQEDFADGHILIDSIGNSSSNQTNKEDPIRGGKLLDFDIGLLKTNPSSNDVEDAVRRGPKTNPKTLPTDAGDHAFPVNILYSKLKNGEVLPRDWLVWSDAKQALFCFPCSLFSKLPPSSRSILSTSIGWGPCKNWKRLYDKLPEHESSINHKSCYVEWRSLEIKLGKEVTVNKLLLRNIQSQVEVWKQLLCRFLDVIIFLGERGLAFRGESNFIGDPRNGNFLGILELISHYDPLLSEHLKKVKESQMEHRRLQVHYLSVEIQNEFIECCANHVIGSILKQREAAKYYSIIVDATPDSAHIEQTVFIIRYVYLCDESNKYVIFERFLAFVNCNQKTGASIADLIIQTLAHHCIPIGDCRGQGYDNGSNMSGMYKGAQAHIKKENPLAIFSPCACHSLNLCGVQAAESCVEVIKFFGVLQKLFTVFSASPQRWQILKENTGCSLHSMSTTRWSARVECVKPFAAHLPGIKKTIDQALDLNLTVEVRADLNGIQSYLENFECILMGSIWFKVLTSINYTSLVLQARDVTLDVEVENIQHLIENITTIRNSWDSIWAECKCVAEYLNILPELSKEQSKRKRCREQSADESLSADAFEQANPEEHFHWQVFNLLLDAVIGNLTKRFEAAKDLCNIFSILWKYPEIEQDQVCECGRQIYEKYSVDISEEICEELLHLKAIHIPNLGQKILPPIDLLNELHEIKLHSLFPNIIVALRLFCTFPVTVAQGERSFSTLSRIKNVLRSTMCQDRLTNLGTLAVESRLAKKLDFNQVIEIFANRKARKAPLK